MLTVHFLTFTQMKPGMLKAIANHTTPALGHSCDNIQDLLGVVEVLLHTDVIRLYECSLGLQCKLELAPPTCYASHPFTFCLRLAVSLSKDLGCRMSPSLFSC